MRSYRLLAATLCLLMLPAGGAWAAGDPVAGKQKAALCLGCHGVKTYFNVYPTYHVPKLGGQHAQYIIAALEEYKSGQRSHGTMHAQASSLSKQDMEDIAAFFASYKQRK
ncbi:MAG: cytochrome c [Gammaproteobacteria bacterium]|jgi:cytochrome c553